MAKKTTGVNVSYDIDNKGKLIIEVDLTKSQGRSKSGKTVIIGSSQGNTRIRDSKGAEFVMGVNVYRAPNEGED